MLGVVANGVPQKDIKRYGFSTYGGRSWRRQAYRTMSTRYPQLTGPLGGVHPAVLNRRVHELLTVTGIGLIPLVIGLAITVANPGRT